MTRNMYAMPLLAALLAVSSPAAGQQPADAADVQAGRTYRLASHLVAGQYAVAQEMTVVQEVVPPSEGDAATAPAAPAPGMPQQKIELLVDTRQAVSAPDASGMRQVSVRFTRLRLKMQAGGEPLAYDSDNPAAGHADLRAGLDALMQAELVAAVDGDGQVREVAGLVELASRLGELAPAGRWMIEAMLPAIRQSLARDLSAGDLLPAEAVAVGQQWTVPAGDAGTFGSRPPVELTCRLAEISDGASQAVITFDGRGGSAEPLGPGVGEQEVQVARLELSLQGQLRLNLQSGLLLVRSVKQEARRHVDLAPPTGRPLRVEIRQQISAQTAIKPIGE